MSKKHLKARHTCINCKKVRYEKYMYVMFSTGTVNYWCCDGCQDGRIDNRRQEKKQAA